MHLQGHTRKCPPRAPNHVYYASAREQGFLSPSPRPPRQTFTSRKNRSKESQRIPSHQDIFHYCNLQSERNSQKGRGVVSKKTRTEQSPLRIMLCQKAIQFYENQVKEQKHLSDMNRRKEALMDYVKAEIESNYRISFDAGKEMSEREQTVVLEYGLRSESRPSTIPSSFQDIHKTESHHFQTKIQDAPAAKSPRHSQIQPPFDKKQDKQNTNSMGYSCQLRIQSNYSLSARRSIMNRSSQSINLKLKSMRLSLSNPMMTETLEKIEIHLTSINYLAQYADWMEEFYKDEREWELAKYLVYQRFSLERERVLESLLGRQNCFFLKDIEIADIQLQMLITHYAQLNQFTQIISQQNNNVKQCLHKIRMSLGRKTLLGKTNTQILYGQLNREFGILGELLDGGVSGEEQEIYKERMMSIMQIVFLIQELDGRYRRGFLECEEMGFREYIDNAYLEYNEVVTARRRNDM